jgi:hypothetical protein
MNNRCFAIVLLVSLTLLTATMLGTLVNATLHMQVVA